MTPEEFKEARLWLDLTIPQLARILDVDPRTIRYWEEDDGTRPPPPMACRVMEWMHGGWRPPEFPKL